MAKIVYNKHAIRRRLAMTKDGKIIGIETIYTIIDGKQINIPSKIEALREMSRNNELFCECGCGTALILVAGDRQLRIQHYRAKSLKDEIARGCTAKSETKESIDSKIALKCWLDAKLQANDLEARVPIYAVNDMDRKYEFTFLSRSQKFGVSFCRDRLNLSDEKLQILDENSQGIRVLYITSNTDALDTLGQYPEYMIKAQKRQGYCLFLETSDMYYNKAKLFVEFYAQDIDGIWVKVPVVSDSLKSFSLSQGHLIYKRRLVHELVTDAKRQYQENLQQELIYRQRKEQEKRLAELRKEQERQEYYRKITEERKARWQAYEAKQAYEQQQRQAYEQQQRLYLEQQNRQFLEQQKQIQEQNFVQALSYHLSQQEKPVWDTNGRRWVRCEVCGKIAPASEFVYYGGAHHVNLGTCKMCDSSL